jgi:5'-nucleotidase
VFSGTVGGAMTGMMLGIPSIGLSQAFTDPKDVPWDTARTLGARVVRELLTVGWSKNACLNVNFPPLPPDQAGPLTLARQGVGMVAGMTVATRNDPRGIAYHWLNFRRSDRKQEPESDYSAMRAGKIVVTPLRYDRTDEDAYAAMAERLPRFDG